MVPLMVDSRFLRVLGCTGLEEIIHGFPMMASEGRYDNLCLVLYPWQNYDFQMHEWS